MTDDDFQERRGSTGREVLVLLLAADVLCVALYVWSSTLAPTRAPHLHLSDDAGWGEFYLHLKQLWLVMLLAGVWWARRNPLLVGWLLVAVFYGVDDVLHAHENVGRWLAGRAPIEALGSDANHLYEVVWLAAWGVVLGTVLLALHLRASPRERRSTAPLAWLFAALIVVGVAVDALHVLVEHLSQVNGLFVIIEEGGEHVLMSILVSGLVATLAASRRLPEQLVRASTQT